VSVTLRGDEARLDASAVALAEVEDHLRELIRSRGVDPSRDAAGARRLVREALDTYSEQTLGGLLPTIADVDDAADRLYDVVAGAGPLQRYLDDPEIEELWIK
jgi:pilus assembly protein CpaF